MGKPHVYILTDSGIHRFVVLALIGVFGFFAISSNRSRAQGLAWSGVNEGSVILLPSGIKSTNLAIAASPALVSPTNLVFMLERQGNVVLTRTSAPPHSLILTSLLAGKYFLTAMVDSPAQPTLGDLSFDIRPVGSGPGNDNWSEAAFLSSPNAAVSGSNLEATAQADEPKPGGSGAGKSIWWAWTASSSEVFTATTAGSNFDTVLGVYTGTNAATLLLVAANDDTGPNAFSQVTFSATNGVTYYFLVDGATGSNGGEAQLRLVEGWPPLLAITFPPDGHLMLVASTSQATNVTAGVTALDPAGIVSVNYWFDGGTNISRSGSLAAPYQLSLSNLLVGHYMLTVSASNSVGLVTVANTGLSVISLEPVLVMDRSGPTPGKLQMGLTGFKGQRYALQSSTNLDVWCGVNAWTNFAGAIKVADTNVAQLQRRFFRATSTP